MPIGATELRKLVSAAMVGGNNAEQNADVVTAPAE
jgi:hypothetical protein